MNLTQPTHPPFESGFHSGELVVQSRAGVRREAARLEGMLAPGDLSVGARSFLAERRLLVVASLDVAGDLWVSPIFGPSGFLDGGGSRLGVAALPASGDPLASLLLGAPIGTIAIDLAARRRLRINGSVSAVDGAGLKIDVEQAFGNCPQYIQPRGVAEDPARSTHRSVFQSVSGGGLPAWIADRIRAADTLFLGTRHPTRGADASHRGGPPGFVRVEGDGSLSWPDYPGNNMFTSLGNLEVDPAAALLFLDFDLRCAIHLSGEAVVEDGGDAHATGDEGSCRRVRFTPSWVTVVDRPGLRATSLRERQTRPGD